MTELLFEKHPAAAVLLAAADKHQEISVPSNL
jgi:hypothetical protein